MQSSSIVKASGLAKSPQNARFRWLRCPPRCLLFPFRLEVVGKDTHVFQRPDYGKTMAQGERKALWIEVHDAETGERQRDLYSAPIPRTRAERERFLNRHVPQIFPGAKLRTYTGAAAKFVRGSLLITAHYGAVADDVELQALEEHYPEPVADSVGQGSLFAA
jgi:hypothetical protein